MTLNGVMAIILRYFTLFGSFGQYFTVVKLEPHHTGCNNHLA